MEVRSLVLRTGTCRARVRPLSRSVRLSTPDILAVAAAVARAFEHAGIEYFLGGSLASSYQGEPRATNDIDFVVAMAEPDVTPFAEALGEDFLVDEPSLRQAVRERRSWNLIHLPTFTKVDLIMQGTGAYDANEFERRERVEVRQGELLFLKRPEDTVLRKLLWYREGGGVSDRQWRDVIGVLRHSAMLLDSSYLDHWARELALDDLLGRARREATEP